MMERDSSCGNRLELLSSTAMLKNVIERNFSSNLDSNTLNRNASQIGEAPNKDSTATTTTTLSTAPSEALTTLESLRGEHLQTRVKTPSPPTIVDASVDSPHHIAHNDASGVGLPLILPRQQPQVHYVHRVDSFPPRCTNTEAYHYGHTPIQVVGTTPRFSHHGFLPPRYGEHHFVRNPSHSGAFTMPLYSTPGSSFDEVAVRSASSRQGTPLPSFGEPRPNGGSTGSGYNHIPRDVHVIESTGSQLRPSSTDSATSNSTESSGTVALYSQHKVDTAGTPPTPPAAVPSMSEEDRQDIGTPTLAAYDTLIRDNFHMRDQLKEKDDVISALQERVHYLETQISELRQLPTGKISHIPIEDMIRIMEEYGSEVSNQTLPKRRETIQKASVVRQFRRWNPEFFRYFIHVNGEWVPKLGKQGELQRRREKRRQWKRNSTSEQQQQQQQRTQLSH